MESNDKFPAWQIFLQCFRSTIVWHWQPTGGTICSALLKSGMTISWSGWQSTAEPWHRMFAVIIFSLMPPLSYYSIELGGTWPAETRVLSKWLKNDCASHELARKRREMTTQIHRNITREMVALTEKKIWKVARSFSWDRANSARISLNRLEIVIKKRPEQAQNATGKWESGILQWQSSELRWR